MSSIRVIADIENVFSGSWGSFQLVKGVLTCPRQDDEKREMDRDTKSLPRPVGSLNDLQMESLFGNKITERLVGSFGGMNQTVGRPSRALRIVIIMLKLVFES